MHLTDKIGHYRRARDSINLKFMSSLSG
ncbi:TPA: hypothetical protein N0F65_005988 [Lagenidium giganteum]|uniref:Uncharacterized protein n=1 Tax=Lagenidium giganteum TaxID=4803 RepID=A0AAV2Z9G7_9STRA|nr:TPA: hypothetical protein N0F65_005988 [Lagenidium giganteum]